MNGTEHPALQKGAEAPPRAEPIEVPSSMRVHCPLVEFKLRQVGAHCPGCEHFCGLEDRFPGSKIAFHKRFSVLCLAKPTERQIFEVEE